MNERIKKLAEQVGIEFTYDPTETPMRAFAECWEDELYQFAQLIVKECLDQIDKIRDGCEADNEDQQALGADWAGLAVARHFGVE